MASPLSKQFLFFVARQIFGNIRLHFLRKYFGNEEVVITRFRRVLQRFCNRKAWLSFILAESIGLDFFIQIFERSHSRNIELVQLLDVTKDAIELGCERLDFGRRKLQTCQLRDVFDFFFRYHEILIRANPRT